MFDDSTVFGSQLQVMWLHVVMHFQVVISLSKHELEFLLVVFPVAQLVSLLQMFYQNSSQLVVTLSHFTWFLRHSDFHICFLDSPGQFSVGVDGFEGVQVAFMCFFEQMQAKIDLLTHAVCEMCCYYLNALTVLLPLLFFVIVNTFCCDVFANRRENVEHVACQLIAEFEA